MSVAAGVLNPASSRAPDGPVGLPKLISAEQFEEREFENLARQLFQHPERRRIFFASTGSETTLLNLCERLGRTVATIYGGPVALVHGLNVSQAELERLDNGSRTAASGVSDPFADKVFHLPAEAFQTKFWGAEEERGGSEFNYVLFGAKITDSAAPLFGKACDGAVLVLTANLTRREAALRAREILLSWNVKLLGAVLNNRTFPVPESIYRRL